MTQESPPESVEEIRAEERESAAAPESEASAGKKLESASKPPVRTGRWRIHALRSLTLAGLALSLYLVHQHARHSSGLDSQAGLCSLIKGSNCAKIENSAFSEMAGIPTAAWGAAYFLAFFIFSIVGPGVAWDAFRPVPLPASGRRGPRKPSRASSKKLGPEFWQISTLLAVLGLLGSLTFATIALAIIKAFCVGCVGVYTITALQAAVLIGGGPEMYFTRTLKAVPSALRTIRVIFRGPEAAGVWGLRGGALAFLLVFPGIFAAPGILEKRLRPAAVADVLKQYAAVQPVEFRETKEGAVETHDILRKGPPAAPIRIVVFTDFLCPHCKRFNGELKKALEDFLPGQFTVVYKHFPIEALCNPLVMKLTNEGRLPKESQHVGACQLAAMAQALHSDYGKFWENSSDLYVAVSEKEEAGPVPSGPEQIKAIAQRAGVDFDEWRKKAGSKSNLKLIEDDIFEATTLGVTSIPAVFINNKRLARPLGSDVSLIMRSILKGEIREKPAK